MDAAELQFAWRGWILGGLFLILGWIRFLSDRDLAPVWLALAFSGAAYRLFAGRHIGGHSNALRMGGEEIAVSGPYLLGRHPLYLGNILTAAGLILFANCLPYWGAGILFFLVCVHHDLLARAEERFLSASRGESYRRYLDATSRWLGPPARLGGPSASLTLDGAIRRQGWGGAIRRQGWGGAIRRQGWGGAIRRQGGNLGKTAAAVLALWALAAIRP
jgi:protein-S-isoprenylcysteine O-methyltransferase Ste14